MARHSAWGRQTRQRVAMEAARIMAEESVRDFGAAKRKAAERLGITARQDMPSNQEIEDELRVYQSLFHAEDQGAQLNRLRSTAIEAMRFLQRFDPRLVGNVLEGTASAHSPVQLHLFASTPEEIDLFLMEHHIPFESDTKQLKYSGTDRRNYPRITFLADDVPIELVIFPLEGLRQAPLSPVTGRPMQRANLRAVTDLSQNAS